MIQKLMGTAFVGATLLVAVPAAAQQAGQPLSEREVKDYFAQMETDVTSIVETGDYQRLHGWVRDNMGRSSMMATLDLYDGDRRRGVTTIALKAEDLLKLTEGAVKVMSGLGRDLVKDYDLEVHVREVRPLGPDTAMATVHYDESGKFVLSAAMGQSDGDQKSADKRDRIELEGTAECEHLVFRDASSQRLQLGIFTCFGEAHH